MNESNLMATPSPYHEKNDPNNKRLRIRKIMNKERKQARKKERKRAGPSTEPPFRTLSKVILWQSYGCAFVKHMSIEMLF